VRDRAARNSIGLHLPQLADEAVSEFCLPPAFAKACHAVGPAEAEPTAWQAILELIARTPLLNASAMPEVSSIQNLMTVKKRSGLSFEKMINRVPAIKASPKAMGASEWFSDRMPVAGNTLLRVLTSAARGRWRGSRWEA
jgi:hypothetical protein